MPEAALAQLRALISEDPDRTVAEITCAVVTADERADEPVIDAVSPASGRSDGKKRVTSCNGNRSATVVARRAEYEREPEEVDVEQPVFIEEFGGNVAMTPARAWAPEGERGLGIVR